MESTTGTNTETGTQDAIDVLTTLPQWVCWHEIERSDGKRTKPPIAPFDDIRGHASPTDPKEWGTWTEALEYHQREDTDTDGLGYVLTTDGNIGSIDIDNCVTEDGEIKQWAWDIITSIDSYAEFSPSGDGVHIYCYAEKPGARCKDEIEMYDSDHYLTITGDHIDGTPTTLEHRQTTYTAIYNEYLSEDSEGEDTHTDNESPDDTYCCSEDTADSETTTTVELTDEEVLQRARIAENRVKFNRLWNGDDSMYEDDTSDADMALCRLLAFYTGGNEKQMDRLFRQSERMRPKWDDIHYRDPDKTYGEGTIETADNDQTTYYTSEPETETKQYVIDLSSEALQRDTDTKAHTQTTTTVEADCGITINCTVTTGDSPPLSVIWKRNQQTITHIMNQGIPTLIDGICSIGKSYTTTKAAIEGEHYITILAPRHELYDQYVEWCDKLGLEDSEYHQLPVFTLDCPTMAGEYGTQWQKRFNAAYDGNVPPSTIHSDAIDMFGETAPCDEDCPYKNGWDKDFKNARVLIGHYSHAFVPSVTENRIPVIDEYKDDPYIEEFSEKKVARYVTNFLQRTENPYFSNVNDLIENRSLGVPSPTQSTYEEWFERYGIADDSQSVTTAIAEHGYDDELVSQTHSMAPLIAYGLLTARKCESDSRWEYADFEATTETFTDETATETARIRLARDRNTSEVRILRTPTFENTNGLIALDGTPSETLWKDTFDIDFDVVQLLNDDERRDYIENTLNMTIVQTTPDAHHRSGACVETTPMTKDDCLIRTISHEYEKPAIIAAKKLLKRYDDMGILSLEYDDHDNITNDNISWYNNMIGSNALGNESVGLILNAEHYGDDHIAWRCALSGEHTEIATDEHGARRKNMDMKYTSELGTAVLKHMREAQVAQALFRFGREESVDSCIVFVNTAAILPWIPVSEQVAVEKLPEKKYQVIRSLRNGARTTESIMDSIEDIGERTVRRILTELTDTEYLTVERYQGKPPKWTPTDKLSSFSPVAASPMG